MSSFSWKVYHPAITSTHILIATHILFEPSHDLSLTNDKGKVVFLYTQEE